MKCIIIEDQTPAQRLLKGYIDAVPELELCSVFSNALDALVYLKDEEIDLIFLDIHLPKLSGIEFLKTVQVNSKVILTTAFSDYALESYDFEVVDYLLKPFSFQRFLKSVTKIQTSSPIITNKTEDEQIFIKSGYEYIKVDLNDLYYIKADGDYTELVLSSTKHLSSQSLKQWKVYLNNNKFTQIHKSYLIQVKLIKKVMGNQVYLNNGLILPIGRAYKEAFINAFITPKGFTI